MKKKVLSLVLALLMTASAASTVLADDVVAISEDTAAEAVAVEEVEEGPYDKAIAFLAAYDIYKGYSADDPAADKDVQRYQMALLVSRIATGWTNDADWMNGKDQWTNFTDIDVEPVNNYFGALSFAVQNKIIEGYGNGKFGPTDGIKYQDALTMVVRTLGYNTLEWPWGYIQKAVELGLTEGITGVSYQEELTRGEVAQIVYNALFAKMKDGSNLALKNFGIEFGWEKVVITASDINTFNKTKTSDGTGVESKFVEFKLLNDDGSLGDDAYKTYAKSFGLDVDAHEDDLAVGHAYYVLFGKDADSSLVEIAAVEPLYTETLENTGKLNDYEIKDFFDKYALVENYSTNSYVNVTASTKDEVLVWDKVSNIVVMEDAGHYIAIDWNTGDILVPAEIKDNKIVDQNGDDEITYTDDWKVAWKRAIYNGEDGNERYYQTVISEEDGRVVGVEWMSKEEFEKTYADTLYKTEKEYKGFSQMKSFSNTAYAALELFDTNLDGVADRGLYESYKLGYFKTLTEGKKCDKCDKKYDTWNITEVGTEEKYLGEDVSVKVNVIPEGTCEHTAYANGWFAEGYEPAVDEDGEYVDSYVIYGFDAETNGIKIVKNLVDDADDDNYVATGVLRAYNAGKETVTIGEDKLSLNYDDLDGTGFHKVNDSKANLNKYDAILNSYFNQFVKYVVVDGEVVHMELAGKPSKTELIVVDGYKGLSADGYIVVTGYSTSDLDYAEFRLGSVDGWKKGDAYYNYNKYDFGRGTVYQVVSYDEAEDAYFVETISKTVELDEEDTNANKKYIYDYVNGFEADYVKITTDAADKYDGVFSKFAYDWKKGEFGTTASYTDMSTKDQWIFIDTNYDEYAVIDVYTGKLPAGVEFTGDLVYAKDGSYIVANTEFAATSTKFLDAFGAGVVILYKENSFDLADYNGTYSEDDRYILGGVEYEARVFNVLTGEQNVTVGAFNKEFDLGYAYYTEAGILTNGRKGNTSETIVKMINDAFTDDTYYAKYIDNIIGNTEFAGLYDADDDNTHKKNVEAMILKELKEIDGSSKARGKINNVTYRVIEMEEVNTRYDSYVQITDINDDIKGDKDGKILSDWLADEGKNYSNLSAFYVYDVQNKNIVIYIVLNDAENVVTTVDTNTTISTEGKTGLKKNAAGDLHAEKAPIVVDEKSAYGAQVEATVKVAKKLDDGKFNGKAAVSEMTFTLADADDTKKLTNAKHSDASFDCHYGTITKDATTGKETWTNNFLADDCADSYAKVTIVAGGKTTVTYAKVTAAAKFDDICGRVKSIKLAIAEADLVYFEEEASVTVDLGLAEGCANSEKYEFTVDICDAYAADGYNLPFNAGVQVLVFAK